jgi:hypothetical protein
MKSYCLVDNSTGNIFKILLTEEDFIGFLVDNPEIDECVNCVECEDAPSITLENN